MNREVEFQAFGKTFVFSVSDDMYRPYYPGNDMVWLQAWDGFILPTRIETDIELPAERLEILQGDVFSDKGLGRHLIWCFAKRFDIGNI